MTPPFDWTPEGDATLIRMLAEIDNLRAERDLYRYALRIIAGQAQSMDNLLSHPEIAREALRLA